MVSRMSFRGDVAVRLGESIRKEVGRRGARWCGWLSRIGHRLEGDMRWRRREWCGDAHGVSSKMHL